jgi:hypothetical protein
MKYGINIAVAFAAVMSFTGVAQADMIFQKNGDSSVVLTIKNDSSATITKVQAGKKGIKTSLIEGKIEGQDSSLVIVREEGDVCPSVSVELYHDIRLGENRAAEVSNQFEEAGTAARQYCADVRVIDGSYTRVK